MNFLQSVLDQCGKYHRPCVICHSLYMLGFNNSRLMLLRILPNNTSPHGPKLSAAFKFSACQKIVLPEDSVSCLTKGIAWICINPSHAMTPFDAPGKQAISPFLTAFSTHLDNCLPFLSNLKIVVCRLFQFERV